jgi:hypothetical protein
MNRSNNSEATGDILCLFEPTDALAAWRNGNLSPWGKSQVEALIALARQKNPRCLLCGAQLKPVGVVGIIGAPGTVRESFALCKACAKSEECDRRIFAALAVEASPLPGEP